MLIPCCKLSKCFSANPPGRDYVLRRHQLFTRLGKPTGFQHLFSQIIVVVIGDNCVLLLLLLCYRLVTGNDFCYGDTKPSQDWENPQVFSNPSLRRSLSLLMLLLLLLVGFGDSLSIFYNITNRGSQQVFSTSPLRR